MSTEAWFAAGFGAAFVGLLFGTALLLILRPSRPIPEEAMWILRVILALAGAGFGAVVSGMLKVDLNISRLTLQATSGFALFVLIYLVNPPRQVANVRSNMKQNVTEGGTGVQVHGSNNDITV